MHGGLNLSGSNVDIKILSYLWTYGSTREIDLIYWGIRRLDQSMENVKSILNKLDDEGRVRKIVYSELEPQTVYVTLSPTLEFGLQLAEMADALGMPRPSPQDIEYMIQIPEESSSIS